MEEKFDVLNEFGEFTGEVATREECHKKGLWHRAVYAFIIDKNSNILLQKRSAKKKLWPNMWDVTVGGHVDAGEFGRQSLIREVKEELGIDIANDDIKYIGSILFGVPFGDIYYLEKDIDIDNIKLQKEKITKSHGLMFKYLCEKIIK